MREITSVALLIGLVVFGASATVAGTQTAVPAEETSTNTEAPNDRMTNEKARETLTDMLFSDSVDRIDFQATTYEEGTALVTASADKIIEIGLPVFGDANDVANRGVEVIRALNSNTARGLYSTFGKDKQMIFIRDQNQARMLGKLVGTTMSIIHEQYGPGISYQDKADKLFHKVRVDPEESASMVEIYLETIEFVENLSSKERAKYFR
jgi:hypothetical protein